MADETLIHRIEEATDRGCILSVLRDVKKALSKTEVRADIRSVVLDSLIRQIKPSFVGQLTDNEFKTIFMELFTLSSPEESLIILTRSIRSADSFALERIIPILNGIEMRYLEKICIGSISKDINDDSWSSISMELSRALIQLPELIYNKQANSVGFSTVKTGESVLRIFLENHWENVRKALEKSLEVAKENVENSVDVNLRFIAALLPALFRRSSKNFRQLVLWLESRPSSVIWERISARFLTDTSCGILHAEDVVLHSAMAATSGPSLLKLFGEAIVNNRIVRRILFYKMILVKVFDPKEKIPRKLCECLRAGNSDTTVDGPWSSLHSEVAVNVLKAWADQSHAVYSSDFHRCYIDTVVLWIVKVASEHLRKALATKLNEPLLNGTQVHLKCSDIRRRIRGMFIAETLTKWLSLGTLNFDYPKESDEDLLDLRKITTDDDDDDDKIEGKDDEDDKIEGKDDEAKEEEKQLRNIEICDVKDCIEVAGEVDSDDELFPSYKIPESEFSLKEGQDSDVYEKKVRPPLYIRDGMEALSEENDCAKFEAAFGALNSLIRRRAVGYDDIASDLLTKLVFLRDRFRIPNFQERRIELISSCLVMSPHLATQLVNIMFSISCVMANRYAILEAISKAATELSSPSECSFSPSSSRCVNVPLKSLFAHKEEGEKSWRVLIDERVAAKTRRFRTELKEREPSRNRFSDVANAFFYPLTAIDVHREHLDLFHEDYALLAKILVLLGHIVHCAQNCSCTPRMTRTLSTYLIPLRRHEQAAIRQSVLFCYSCICLSLPNDALIELFGDSLMEWFRYASSLAEADPSTDCREMAQRSMQLLALLFRETIPKADVSSVL